MIVFIWVLSAILLLFLITAITGAPYVPSQHRDVRYVFRKGRKLTPDDVVVDVGSGDGTVLIEAVKAGAKAIGYEINPILVLVSKWRTRKYGDRVQVIWANIWRQKPLERVSVIYTFGDGRDIRKMYNFAKRQANHQMQPLTFISYGFAVPDISGVECGAYMLYEVSPESPK